MAAARAVGNQLQANWSLEEANQHLSEVNTIVGAITEGVIVWNQQGEIRHVNAQAGEMLQINARAAVGRSIAHLFTAANSSVIVTGSSIRALFADWNTKRRFSSTTKAICSGRD
jgi:sensor histidine kinase regulating citrate/malate metabolism